MHWCKFLLDFPGSSDGKESTWDVGDLGSIPGLGRSLEGGHSNPVFLPREKFLSVILSGVNSASGLCRFILLPKLRSFQLLSLRILLCSFLFFLSFQNSNDTDVRLFVTIPQILEALFIFSLCSLCCSDNVISIVLSMKFLKACFSKNMNKN